jgi:hypothetical protein
MGKTYVKGKVGIGYKMLVSSVGYIQFHSGIQLTVLSRFDWIITS